MSFGNGTSQAYGFDAVSRLTSLTSNLSGTANDQTLGMGYSPASQIVSQTRSNDAYAWTGATAVSRNYAANGLNQYSQSGAIVPTYDARGNLTSAGSTTYAYTSENLLKSASGSENATLSYDPALRLYKLISGANTTRFLYDGLNMIAEYDGSNAVQRRYVFGPGVDEPLVQYEGSGTATRRFLHADERGSIVALSDGTGAQFAINAYDEYGIPNASNYGRFQYTGQAWLPELGIYYYKARMYSPSMGRFLQTDPIDVAGGINLYAYVGNDPVNWVDPLGFDGCIQPYDVCGKPPADPRLPDIGLVSRQPPAVLANLELNDADGECTVAVQCIIVTGTRKKKIYVTLLPSLDPLTFFSYYLHGDGNVVCLTSSQFSQILGKMKISLNAPRQGAQVVSFYGTDLENTFGSSTIYFNNNKPTGFYDFYDFNLGNASRSTSGQIKTVVGSIAGAGGQPFEVKYPC